MNQRLCWRGYIITDGHILHVDTLRSNRAEAWTALYGKPLGQAERRRLQRKGVRCVPVQLIEDEKRL